MSHTQKNARTGTGKSRKSWRLHEQITQCRQDNRFKCLVDVIPTAVIELHLVLLGLWKEFCPTLSPFWHSASALFWLFYENKSDSTGGSEYRGSDYFLKKLWTGAASRWREQIAH